MLSLAISPDSKRMASGGRDWSILLWDLQRTPPQVTLGPRDEAAIPTIYPLATVDAHRCHINSLAFSAPEAGGLLATAGNDHRVSVWKVTTGMTGGVGLSEVWTSGASGSGGHSSSVAKVAWGRGADVATQQLLFSAGWDATVKVWSGCKPLKRSAAVGSMLLGPGGAGSGAAGTAGAPASPLPPIATVLGGDYGSDGMAAGGSGDEIVPLRTLTGHTARVTSLDVAPLGDVLVSVSADMTARLWRIRDPFPCIAVFHAASRGDGVLTSVSVGNHVFVTGSDENGMICVWPLRPTGPLASRFITNGLPGGGGGAGVVDGGGAAGAAAVLPSLPAAGAAAAAAAPAARAVVDASAIAGGGGFMAAGPHGMLPSGAGFGDAPGLLMAPGGGGGGGGIPAVLSARRMAASSNAIHYQPLATSGGGGGIGGGTSVAAGSGDAVPLRHNVSGGSGGSDHRPLLQQHGEGGATVTTGMTPLVAAAAAGGGGEPRRDSGF